jgi:uncharacterized Rmd1/YagE family protein
MNIWLPNHGLVHRRRKLFSPTMNFVEFHFHRKKNRIPSTGNFSGENGIRRNSSSVKTFSAKMECTPNHILEKSVFLNLFELVTQETIEKQL